MNSFERAFVYRCKKEGFEYKSMRTVDYFCDFIVSHGSTVFLVELKDWKYWNWKKYLTKQPLQHASLSRFPKVVRYLVKTKGVVKTLDIKGKPIRDDVLYKDWTIAQLFIL